MEFIINVKLPLVEGKILQEETSRSSPNVPHFPRQVCIRDENAQIHVKATIIIRFLRR
jgi:hypothetical protein